MYLLIEKESEAKSADTSVKLAQVAIPWKNFSTCQLFLSSLTNVGDFFLC